MVNETGLFFVLILMAIFYVETYSLSL